MNKPQSQFNTFSEYVRFLTHYLRPRLRWVLLLAVTLLVSIGLQLANPQIVRTFIDAAMAGGAIRDLTITALLFLGVALARQAVSLAVNYLAQNVAWAATNALRLDLVLHCLRLDLSFHKARTPGELIERVDGDVSELANFFSQMIVRLLGNSLLVLGILILLFREDWRVGLIGAVYILLAAILLRQVQKPATKAWSDSRQAHAELFGFLGEKEEMRRLWAEQLYGDRAGNPYTEVSRRAIFWARKR